MDAKAGVITRTYDADSRKIAISNQTAFINTQNSNGAGLLASKLFWLRIRAKEARISQLRPAKFIALAFGLGLIVNCGLEVSGSFSHQQRAIARPIEGRPKLLKTGYRGDYCLERCMKSLWPTCTLKGKDVVY